MAEKRETRDLAAFFAVALVLLGSYVGAYYGTVEVGGWTLIGATGYTPLYPGIAPDGTRWLTPHGWLGFLFAPMHAIDRRLRPHIWEPQ